MLFNSLEFILFAGIFFSLWKIIRSRSANTRYAYLILCSLFFYGWWDYRFVTLLIGVGVFNWTVGLLIDRYRQCSKGILVGAIAADILVLFTFKYLDFLSAMFSMLAILSTCLP